MADNEDDSSSTRTITAMGLSESATQASTAPCNQSEYTVQSTSGSVTHQRGENLPAVAAEPRGQAVENTETVSGAESGQLGEILPTEPGARLADFLQSCPAEQSILVGTEFAGLGSDLVNTTIIYVQPDGSLVEGTGLTVEEQQALLDQLTKQPIVQVTDNEAVQLLQQSQLVKTIPVPNATLDPSQLQQVINQVTKSQQQVSLPQQQVHVQVPQQTQKQVQLCHQSPKQQVQSALKQVSQQNLKNTTQNNASQQLKSVAQQVAMQTSSSVQLVQKKPEPVRIQIQVPPKPEVKPGTTTQHQNVAVSHPQVKLSTNGNVGSAQVIHIQPVVGQQAHQFFLQQSPGDPPIQLLLQSSTPVVSSLLPLVHKVPGETSSGVASGLAQKPSSSPIRAQAPAIIKATPTPIIKTTPTTHSTRTATVQLTSVQTHANGATTPVCSPVKPPAVITAVPVQTAPPSAPAAVTLAVKDREREKEAKKKEKKKEKRAIKVQTRSGRVSRPPKYKAKDYKFIKTEDLADSHQSDSDDYSDMSVEDEEGESVRKEGSGTGTSPSLIYSHKSRAHHCQTCDKAYIGPGGLNRHYKLNPTHGDPEPPGNTTMPSSETLQSEEKTEIVKEEDKTKEDRPAATAPSRMEGGPAAAVGLRVLQQRGPGRPRGRGRGRGRGRHLVPPPKVAMGLVTRRGRRGRPPKHSVTIVTAEQQAEKRRDRLQELVEQCEDEELMDIVLPRLTKVLSLWELLLAKVERGAAARTRFPDIYREFESLQAQVRQAAQDYIVSPQGAATPLEIRNIEVARSLGIVDEVNKMKVIPGASPSFSLNNKNVRYMENSKMLPPSKRFKMESTVSVQQNGVNSKTGGTAVAPPVASAVKSCSVSVSPVIVPTRSTLMTSAGSASSSSSSTSAEMPSSQIPPSNTPIDAVEVSLGENNFTAQLEPQLTDQQHVLGTSDTAKQIKEFEKVLGPEIIVDTKTTASSPVQTDSGTVQALASSEVQQKTYSQTESMTTDPKELQEGQEIYIQTDGLTVQLAEPGSDRIVIVNGPDGTTMHIQTPEGVPLEAVQALLGIEASDGAKVPQ